MNRRTADHRPLHGGYPQPEEPAVAPPAAGAILPLAERVAAELAAGAATVRIDAIDPADADYVPASMLVKIDPPGVREVSFSVEGDPDEFRKPTGVWLDEMADWPSDEAFAALETADRVQRGTLTHPAGHQKPQRRGVEPGFAFEV